MGVILEDLKKEKDQLNKALTIIPKKKADAEARRDKFQGPAAETQKLAKNSCDSANLIKQQIIALGGNTGFSTGLYGTSVSSITSVYGNVVGLATTATGSSVGIVGLGSAIIAVGYVYEDIIKGYDYPVISGENYGAEYPWSGEGYYEVTDNNLGLGKSTKFFRSGGSQIGVVFHISSLDSQIANLKSEYSVGLTSVTAQCDIATRTQGRKNEQEFVIWSYGREEQIKNDRIAEIDNAITDVSNPQYGGPW
mgnify:FL=1|tara:strand:+ start:60 stop:812 length:753 start_codon:yes stop_codon:yes gene_type:complete